MFVPASELMFKSRQVSSQIQKSIDPLFLNQLNQDYEVFPLTFHSFIHPFIYLFIHLFIILGAKTTIS
jgi:hypothetical protein